MFALTNGPVGPHLHLDHGVLRRLAPVRARAPAVVDLAHVVGAAGGGGVAGGGRGGEADAAFAVAGVEGALAGAGWDYV